MVPISAIRPTALSIPWYHRRSVGDLMIYVSGGAERQGPSGGGPVAVIARRA